MDQEHASLLSIVQAPLEPIIVQADSLRVIVRVRDGIDPDVLEDCGVVGPSRVGDVDLLLAGGERVEFGEEEGAEMVGSGAGDGLGAVREYDQAASSEQK